MPALKQNIVRRVRAAATGWKTGLAVAGLVLSMGAGASPARADAAFRAWVADFKQTATASGISSSTFDRAFVGIEDADPEVLQKARFQPEFKAPVWDYFDNRVQDQSVAVGRAMVKKWAPWLDRIEAQYGVDRYVLLAIWSMESNYGEILKRKDVMRNVVRSLSTLAYGDKRRAKFARTQLIAALKILQSGDIDESHLTGSWAGAMGHTQFIPTSYQLFAVDEDGDGRRDIWTSVPDALATAANLLKKSGWQAGKTWGYEVSLPAGAKFPAGKATIAKFQSLGIERANGKPFKKPADTVELKVPDGRGGPAFLMTKNFKVIKSYNNADKYALAVGLLADQIAGGSGLVQDWNRPFTKLSFAERQELQERLSSYGYYNGKTDGKIGETSKQAIIAFQEQNGMEPTGHPSLEVLSQLRGR